MMEHDPKSIPDNPPPAQADPSNARAERVATVDVAALERNVVAALRTIYDPEIPVNIYDLGLIYALAVEPTGAVGVRMTLTAPGCPVAQSFPATVAARVRQVPGVTDAHVELIWEPRWTRDRMSEAARLELGML
jgi:FeS assembly SUF system protein